MCFDCGLESEKVADDIKREEKQNAENIEQTKDKSKIGFQL
jgi:hypothetical protein